jgi:hypothetical protein
MFYDYHNYKNKNDHNNNRHGRIYHNYVTERRGRVVNTPASYSGDQGFRSRPGDRLSCLRFFVVSISPSRRMPG